MTSFAPELPHICGPTAPSATHVLHFQTVGISAARKASILGTVSDRMLEKAAFSHKALVVAPSNGHITPIHTMRKHPGLMCARRETRYAAGTRILAHAIE